MLQKLTMIVNLCDMRRIVSSRQIRTVNSCDMSDIYRLKYMLRCEARAPEMA